MHGAITLHTTYTNAPLVRQCLAAIVGALIVSGCSTTGELTIGDGYNQRFYAGAGLLMSNLEPDTDDVPGVSVGESTSEGFSLTAGLDVSRDFSVEAHLADLGQAELDPTGEVSYEVGGISGLVYGFNRRKDRGERIGLALFGRLGLGLLENDSQGVDYERVNSTHLLVGAGAEYGLDNGLSARAEVVAHERDAKYFQVGIVYRFGEAGIYPAMQGEPAQRATAVVVDPAPPSETVTGSIAQTTADLVTPVVDDDLDGVPDSVDRCPGTQSGLPVKLDGCEVFDGVIEGINFESGSDLLTPDAILILADISQTLLDYPDIKVAIEAHTDNQGSAVENLQLSRRRAVAVARFLVDQGVSGARLKPQAFGESKPRASNQTAEGRASNRRVEFSVFR